MSDTLTTALTIVTAIAGGGAGGGVAVAWLKERGKRAQAHDARDTARDERVETLEGDADNLRAELKALITDSAAACEEKVRTAIAASEAGCAKLLAASEERSTGRAVAAEARADRLIEQLTQALTRAGALSADSTGVHELGSAIREGRQSRSTPRSWPAADPDEESGGER